MTEDTSGQTWNSGALSYSGPGPTAEWIVEEPAPVPGDGPGVLLGPRHRLRHGPGDARVPNTACGSVNDQKGLGQCAMAAYGPAVTFSALGIAATGVVARDQYVLERSGPEG